MEVLLAAATAVSQRTAAEANLKGLNSVYIKCVQLSADAARKTRDHEAPYHLDFMLYSALAEKGLVKSSADGTIEFGYVCPFWAVMLSDRDNANLVNMHPCIGDYKIPSPVGKTYPLSFDVNMSVKLPFLTNKTALSSGELLVLPFDGGCNEIFSVPPSLRLCES